MISSVRLVLPPRCGYPDKCGKGRTDGSDDDDMDERHSAADRTGLFGGNDWWSQVDKAEGDGAQTLEPAATENKAYVRGSGYHVIVPDFCDLEGQGGEMSGSQQPKQRK